MYVKYTSNVREIHANVNACYVCTDASNIKCLTIMLSIMLYLVGSSSHTTLHGFDAHYQG